MIFLDMLTVTEGWKGRELWEGCGMGPGGSMHIYIYIYIYIYILSLGFPFGESSGRGDLRKDLLEKGDLPHRTRGRGIIQSPTQCDVNLQRLFEREANQQQALGHTSLREIGKLCLLEPHLGVGYVARQICH